MFLKALFDRPILALAALSFILVFMYAQGWHILSNPKLKPTSCRAALVKLQRLSPGNWQLACEDNNLRLEIREHQVPAALEVAAARPLLYRQLANYLTQLAKMSEPDHLGRITIIHLKIIHPKMEINSITEGKDIIKLLTLRTQEFILDHLKHTVQVKETLKP
jgi:hypothetical protein